MLGDEGESDSCAGARDTGSGGQRDKDSKTLPGDSLRSTPEAEGRKKIVGDLEPRTCLRAKVNPLESSGKDRRDLTISTLIAECEEYVKTDEFTKDFSDNLLHLFAQNKSECNNMVKNNDHKPENLSKPPKIPESMRSGSKSSNKTDKNETQNSPKFPVHPRSSTYDNVNYELEVEDEGIGNDFDDNEESVNSRTPPSLPSSCLSGLCDKHESSPALTSEGYDSAHESGRYI